MATTVEVPSEQGSVRTEYATLGRSADGRGLPRLRQRLTPLHYGSNPLWGWLGPLAITALAGVLRFWGIKKPSSITFDETYYAKDAWSLLTKHYAAVFHNPSETEVNEADAIINNGQTTGIFELRTDDAGHVSDIASQVVHPELGKWMIAVGEWMFGLTPLGWRFSSAVVGALMVLVMCRLVRRLTGSTLLGCVAGLLLTFDGLALVMSRIALLDIFLAFWLLCAVHCLVADRDWARTKLARRFEVTPPDFRRGFGPVRGFLLRPWRLAAGVCFGCAGGVKWSGVFVLAGFALLMWAWDSGMRRAVGVRFAPAKSFVVDAIPAAFTLVGTAVATYVLTWIGFLTHASKFVNEFGWKLSPATHETPSTRVADWSTYGEEVPDGWLGRAWYSLRALWSYHHKVYEFHTGDYIEAATHPWQSDPGGWLIINRPLLIASHSGGRDVIADCPVGGNCVRQIMAIGTPILWWAGLAALFVCLFYWLARRDWRFGVPIVGVLTTWLPWFRYDDRPIFFYYCIITIPFTIIGLTLVLGKVLGPRTASRERRMVGAVAAGALVMAVFWNFAYFWPIFTDQTISNNEWQDRMWFDKWI
jgi:dolichyl-phosphate-mannose-protein mannosyltransferase